MINKMKRLLRAENWKYVIAFLAPMALVMVLNGGLDNDSWGVLAEGRQILESGLYHEDMLSMHEGLHVVIQNYSFSVVFYLIHSVFGAPGIYVVMLLLNFAVMLLLYKICMLLSNKNVKLSLILMAVTDGVLAFEFIVTRAQMIDYVVLLALIYVLELYVKTGRFKYLWWVPVFSLVLANCHASVWWMIFAIMITYIIDAVRQKYKMKPLLAVAAVVGLINPYGLEMLTSIFTAYGGLAKFGFVSELSPPNPLLGSNAVYYLALVVTIALYAFGEGKNVRIRFLLMLFGFLMIGLSSVKGMSEAILVMFFPMALVYGRQKIPEVFGGNKIGRVAMGKATTMWVGIVTIGVTGAMLAGTIIQMEDRPSASMERALDAIDAEVGDKDKKDLKVYVGYNQGGYVEYRGYPAYMDPRGAEFTEVVNGKEEIMGEWMDLQDGKMSMQDFLTKYDFDFLLIQKYEDRIYDMEDERYELIYEYEGEGEYDGDRVYKKIDS